MDFSQMLMWQWLMFELPALFGALLMVGSLFSGADGDDGHGDHGDHGGDHGEGDLEDASHAETPGITGRIFGFFGFGKAPLMVVLSTMGLTYGMIGGLLTKQLGLAWALPNAGIAFVGMCISTNIVARVVARLMPKTESEAVSKTSFMGRVGVLTLPATTTYGEARIYDDYGYSHLCKCVASAGDLPKGEQVLLLEYDETLAGYYVERYQT